MNDSACASENQSKSQEFATIGVISKEEDMILVITTGLLCSYNIFTIALNSTPTDKLTLNSVIICLLNEDSCAEHSHFTNNINKKLLAKTIAYVSYKYMNLKHSTNYSQSYTDTFNLSRITCYNCEKKNHYQINCLLKNLNQLSTTIVETAEAAIVKDNNHGNDLD